MNEMGNNRKKGFVSSSFLPQEELLEKKIQSKKLTIGIPRELEGDEKRVALTPESVNLLVENDNEV